MGWLASVTSGLFCLTLAKTICLTLPSIRNYRVSTVFPISGFDINSGIYDLTPARQIYKKKRQVIKLVNCFQTLD